MAQEELTLAGPVGQVYAMTTTNKGVLFAGTQVNTIVALQLFSRI